MFLFNPVPNEMCCLIIIIVMVIHVSNHNLVFQFIPFWALECFPSPRILSQSKVWVLDWSWEIFRSLEVQIISRSRLLPADLLRGQQICCSFLSFIIFDLSLKYFIEVMHVDVRDIAKCKALTMELDEIKVLNLGLRA